MGRRVFAVVIGLSALAGVFEGPKGGRAWAESPDLTDLPPALRPWMGWVLHGHQEQRCPFLQDGDRRRCQWPSRLELRVDDKGGRFQQQWVLHRAELVPLPGESRRWPQTVRVDGRPAAVVERGGVPHVRLVEGRHRVGGAFLWDRLPESLPIPAATGLLALRVGGRDVPFPRREADGRLWLRSKGSAATAEDHLEVVVHRKVIDDLPLQLHTRLVLRVSGRHREVAFERPLPPGFVPMSLTAGVPARIDGEGVVQLQVRPGRWVIDLAARHRGPVARLALPKPTGPWPSEEVWAFEARADLRVVTIEGVRAIDPRQTTLPDDWKRLPCYRMQPGRAMLLEQQRRGDSDPPADRLSLERRLMLDFDGGGLTVADRLSGALRRSWRVEMQQDTRLGRVALGGQDQLITRRGDKGFSGVEVRGGQLDLEADSRYVGDLSDVPAVGWNHDMQQVSASPAPAARMASSAREGR